MYKPTISQLEQYENIVKHELFDYDAFVNVDTLLMHRTPRSVSRVAIETLDRALYYLESINVYAPRAIYNGRDVMLLFATLGQKENDPIAHHVIKTALERLRVHMRDGAYYLYLDTCIKSGSASYKDVTVYAAYEAVDGLQSRAAVAGIEKPDFYGQAQRARLEAKR